MYNHQAFSFLQNRLEQEPHERYPISSRIHVLKSFNLSPSSSCFVKRDDELSFGVSGGKFRKYRTLIPDLRKDQCQEVIIIGSPYSNHVLAITQLLIENGIQTTLFLKGSSPPEVRGNFLLLRLLVPSSSIQWIAKTDWPSVESLASAYAATKDNICILPEGATLFSTFLGALTLPLDILRNEEELGIEFDHLFIEAGTGWSAAALLLGFAYLEKRTFCHLLLLADIPEDFERQLQILHAEFELWLGTKSHFPSRFLCETSSLAPSFGSTNRAIFQFIVEIARAEGFFLDPIYSAKLFHYAKRKIQEERLVGNILLVHSGGALTLAGFQDRLEAEVRN